MAQPGRNRIARVRLGFRAALASRRIRVRIPDPSRYARARLKTALQINQRLAALLLVQLALERGQPSTTACQAAGLSRVTRWRWLRRFQQGGPVALALRTFRCGRPPKNPATHRRPVPHISFPMRARLLSGRHGPFVLQFDWAGFSR